MTKRQIEFEHPIMNAAGSLGFLPDTRAPVRWNEFGAFVTNPISMRPRSATESPALIEFSGGFLLHTGLPNPGFHRVLQQYGRGWERSALPIIVNVMADRPEETADIVSAVENLDNLMAVELGFAPLLADDIVLLAVEMSLGELPMIVSLPGDQLLRLGPKILEVGAAALSLSPPRGTLTHEGGRQSGRLFGPALFPLSLDLVRIASRLGLPVIASGGIFSPEGVQAMLQAGALAVQLDARLWLPTDNKKSLVN